MPGNLSPSFSANSLICSNSGATFPPTPIIATFKLVAELCKKYNIPVTPKTVLTHYEFGQANPKTSSYGKIDIIYLHAYPQIQKEAMGDFIRNKVIWYLSKM